MSSFAEVLWTAMPPMKTQSAHARSRSRTASVFMSMSRFSHALGSIAATVSRPNGGWRAFFDMNLKACLKLQKVSGYLG